MQGVSTLFRLVLGLFLGLAQGHGLFKGLSNFIQAFVVEIMYALGAFGVQVNQLVVITHGLAYAVAGMPQ